MLLFLLLLVVLVAAFGIGDVLEGLLFVLLLIAAVAALVGYLAARWLRSIGR